MIQAHPRLPKQFAMVYNTSGLHSACTRKVKFSFKRNTCGNVYLCSCVMRSHASETPFVGWHCMSVQPKITEHLTYSFVWSSHTYRNTFHELALHATKHRISLNYITPSEL